MHTGTLTSRRRFLCLTGSLAAGIALPAIPPTVLAAGKKEGKEKESEVNPVEDLMREHGVLRRVLLIYEEAISRIYGAKELPSGVIADSARIIRRFVEDYHEKLEEDEIFPRFEKAGKLNDLVNVLFVQHQAGRRLTDSILKLSESGRLKLPKQSKRRLHPCYRSMAGLLCFDGKAQIQSKICLRPCNSSFRCTGPTQPGKIQCFSLLFAR